MDEIVPRRKHHQRKHESQTDPKTVFLRPLAQRLSAEGLGGVKEQMSAIEDRNRKQVDEPKIDRQNRHEPEDGNNPALSDLTGHLRDTQRSAELVRAARSLNHLPERAQRP